MLQRLKLCGLAELILFSIFLTSACAKVQKRAPSQAATETNVSTADSATTKPTQEPEAVAASPSRSITCKKPGDTRILNTEKKSGGCSLTYLKAGKKSVVATAQSGADYCDKTGDKIRSKLESAGYQCQ